MKQARPSPLDSVGEVATATAFLRGPSGKLSAVSVAKLYGVSQAQLAKWLGRSPRSVARNPEAAALQAKLEFFARVARLLAVLPENDFRRWLLAPNPNLQGETPLAWMDKRRWQQLADLVDDMLTGAPT